MNFTQSFEEFSSGFDRMNIFVYAGAAIIAWVLLKDKININPVKNWLQDTFQLLKNQTQSTVNIISKEIEPTSESKFFDLVAAWKKTRDLAEELKCHEAVEVADEMFPYLSPGICDKPQVVKPKTPGVNNEK